MARRGEIWWATLPQSGAEPPEFNDGTRRRHPHLVVATPEPGLLLACPMTTGRDDRRRHGLPVAIADLTWIDHGTPCEPSTILVSQLRSLSRRRLVGQAGRLRPDRLAEVLIVLRGMLGIDE